MQTHGCQWEACNLARQAHDVHIEARPISGWRPGTERSRTRSRCVILGVSQPYPSAPHSPIRMIHLRRINPLILHRAEFYTERMDIPLTWGDLVKLASNGKVEKDGNTLSVSRPILPDLQIFADGLRGFVRFTVDESNPSRRLKSLHACRGSLN
jgi:hypothetical protein